MFPDGLLDLFSLYGRIVDSSAEVTFFTNVLVRANFATGAIDAVVCAAKRVAKYLLSATRDMV